MFFICLYCSLYREAQTCFVARADAAKICTPSTLAAAMKPSLSILVQISKALYQSIPTLPIDLSKMSLDITECEGKFSVAIFTQLSLLKQSLKSTIFILL